MYSQRVASDNFPRSNALALNFFIFRDLRHYPICTDTFTSINTTTFTIRKHGYLLIEGGERRGTALSPGTFLLQHHGGSKAGRQ